MTLPLNPLKMTLLKKFKFELVLMAALIVLGQIVFFAVSNEFTQMSYEGRIYVTNGVGHREDDDLHSLQNAAHYFNETVIGWMRFPSFQPQVKEFAGLPEDAVVGGYMQEHQNVIFTVSSAQNMEVSQLEKVRDFIHLKLDDYNTRNDTGYYLTNPDYEVVTVQKSYRFGAAVALLVAVVLAVGTGFIRRELF